MTSAIRRRTVRTNGIDLAVREAGDPGAPLVVLAHGFPETSHSWRHQMLPLAEAGWHVVAPDQRGYGGSTSPREVGAYGTDELSADLLGLAESLGHERAVYVGHDWGALLLWDLCRMHPGRVVAGVAASVAFADWPAPPLDIMARRYGDRFFYINYFQRPHEAETELGRDVTDTMAKVLWGASAGAQSDPMFFTRDELPPMEGTGFLTGRQDPPPLPWPWLNEEEFAAYVDDFAASGFFGPVSWYRNMNANYERTRHHAVAAMTMPVHFITGELDPVNLVNPAFDESMRASLPGYRGSTVVAGAGHWVQQEKPAEFNAALLGFLSSL